MMGSKRSLSIKVMPCRRTIHCYWRAFTHRVKGIMAMARDL
jgi:hypothetical protein